MSERDREVFNVLRLIRHHTDKEALVPKAEADILHSLHFGTGRKVTNKAREIEQRAN